MACNMPNVNVTYTIVNCRHARDFTNVKAPAPTAQEAQSTRPQAQTSPTTGDARGEALARAQGYASKAVPRRGTHSPAHAPALTYWRHTTEGLGWDCGRVLWALQGWRGWGFYICTLTFNSLLLRRV